MGGGPRPSPGSGGGRGTGSLVYGNGDQRLNKLNLPAPVAQGTEHAPPKLVIYPPVVLARGDLARTSAQSSSQRVSLRTCIRFWRAQRQPRCAQTLQTPISAQ